MNKSLIRGIIVGSVICSLSGIVVADDGAATAVPAAPGTGSMPTLPATNGTQGGPVKGNVKGNKTRSKRPVKQNGNGGTENVTDDGEPDDLDSD